MYEITNIEFNRISREIDRQGLTYTLLKNELLDHICCEIEEQMFEEKSFDNAFKTTFMEIGNKRITDIQEETLLLVNHKYKVMKKLMFTLGIISPLLVVFGLIGKMYHLPFAGAALVLGIFLLAVFFLPVFISVKIRDTRKNKQSVNIPLVVFGILSSLSFFVGTLFKVQHWPGAGIIITIGLGLFAAVVIPIYTLVRIKQDRERKGDPKLFLNLSGSLGSISFTIGALFKLMHWPGASVLLTLGLLTLAIAFIPAFVMNNISNLKARSVKVNYLFHYTGMITGMAYLFGILFKMLHWPGAAIMALGSIALMFLVFFPLLIFQLYSDRENREPNLMTLIYLLVFTASTLLIFMAKESGMGGINAPLVL